jgi:hypothetical protein
MFELPSLWNLIVSTIVFFIAVWYLRRLLNEHDIPAGMTRSLLVFVLAYVVSWGAGALVDWVDVKLYGPQPVSQSTQDFNALLKASGLPPP